MDGHSIRFLTLGDSYTIGESVDPQERWPVQLASTMRSLGIPLDDPVIIARTGWTTGELRSGIDAAGLSQPCDLVSLMVGVNDQYRGLDLLQYQRNFRALLALATSYTGDNPSRVIVISIPDWGATPYAQGRDRERIAAEVDRFNQVNRDETLRSGARYVDITPLSRQAAGDPTLIAEDGLHPSGKMYAVWVKQVLSVALQALGESRAGAPSSDGCADVANGYTGQDK